MGCAQQRCCESQPNPLSGFKHEEVRHCGIYGNASDFRFYFFFVSQSVLCGRNAFCWFSVFVQKANPVWRINKFQKQYMNFLVVKHLTACSSLFLKYDQLWMEGSVIIKCRLQSAVHFWRENLFAFFLSIAALKENCLVFVTEHHGESAQLLWTVVSSLAGKLHLAVFLVWKMGSCALCRGGTEKYSALCDFCWKNNVEISRVFFFYRLKKMRTFSDKD